mmetsp:Transcript_21353/g.62240  ORF Transcript_21353/g.62240 Transcript_21353/m.62240 type:complete len:208 (-) Transcript_21353:1991-2614(-)
MLNPRLSELGRDQLQQRPPRFGRHCRPDLAQAHAHEAGQDKLSAQHLLDPLVRIFPEFLEGLLGVDASALGPQFLHARRVPVTVTLDEARARIPLHQFGHPLVAKVLKKGEGSGSCRFAFGDVVPRDEASLELGTTGLAPFQEDPVYVASVDRVVLHHLATEVVDVEGRLRRERRHLVHQQRERPEHVEPIARAAVEAVEGHGLVPR